MNVELLSSCPGELVNGIGVVVSGVSILGNFKKESRNEDETKTESSVGDCVADVFVVEFSFNLPIVLVNHISSNQKETPELFLVCKITIGVLLTPCSDILE